MIKDLAKLSNHLDSKGLLKEADYLDSIIAKLAEDGSNETAVKVSYKVRAGDTMDDIGKAHTYPNTNKTLKDNLKLNNMKEDETIYPGQDLTIWSTSAYEGFANNPTLSE
jgi:hypothetical protein